MCFALPLPHYFDAQPMKNKTNGGVQEDTGSLGCYYIFFYLSKLWPFSFSYFTSPSLSRSGRVLFCQRHSKTHRRRKVLFSVYLKRLARKENALRFYSIFLFCFLVLFVFFEMDFASSGEL